MSEVHWTEIDGVPAAWVDANRRLSVGMTFRVGRCDESLATCGRVHLLEHIVASQLPNPDRLVDGATDGLTTVFSTGADGPAAMGDFVTSVCRSLTSLSQTSVEREVGRILAEEHGDPGSLEGTTLQMRYGYRHWGLQDAPQFGVETATIVDLQRLVAQYFTRDNLFLTFVGRPRGGLRLDLPQGSRQPIPPLRSCLPSTPAWCIDSNFAGIAVAAVVPDTPASALFLAVANARLDQALRQDAGVSYDTGVSQIELNGAFDHLLLFADSEPSRREEVTRRFADVVAGLEHITESEVEEERRQLVDFTVGRYAPTPEETAQNALGNAIASWLLERPYKPLDAYVAEQRALTAAQVSECGRLLRRGALWVLSEDVAAADIMGPPVPPSSAARMTKGEDFPTLDVGQTLPTLMLSEEAVGMLDEQDERAYLTVRYADVEALCSFDDGGLVLMASDGTDMIVEPTLWFSGAEVAGKIRGRVPSELHIALGARPPEAIPRPSTRTGRLFGRLFGK